VYALVCQGNALARIYTEPIILKLINYPFEPLYDTLHRVGEPVVDIEEISLVVVWSDCYVRSLQVNCDNKSNIGRA
jgi:hypothetical protein